MKIDWLEQFSRTLTLLADTPDKATILMKHTDTAVGRIVGTFREIDMALGVSGETVDLSNSNHAFRVLSGEDVL